MGVLLYGVAGGTAGLFIGLREEWWETRLLTFSGGWWLLGAADDRIQAHWATLAAGIVLAAPVWWHGLHYPEALPLRLARPSRGRTSRERGSRGGPPARHSTSW